MVKIILLGLAIIIVCYVIVAAYVFRFRYSNNRILPNQLYCKLSGKSHSSVGPIIFIPGTKGSLLEQRSNKAWLTLRQLFPGKVELAYAENDNYQATGILDKISLIPGILEYRTYTQIIKALACQSKAYVYYYDWRKNPIDNGPGLADLVDRVTKESGQKPAIIAHSMGGLITHYFMKTQASKVGKVVYVGVPFGSGLSFLDDINNGSKVGLNKSILSVRALFSHPGSFALLPHPGASLYKEQGLMAEQTWINEKLSVYKNQENGGNNQILTSNINQAKQLFSALDKPVAMTNQFLFVIGNCQSTLARIDKDGQRIYEPGDGRVLASAALPVEQEMIAKTVINSCVVHDQQLNDKDIVNNIFDFLQ